MNKKNKKNKSNRNILISTYMFLLVFIGLAAYIIYFDTVKAESVINNSYNSRQEVLANRVERGDILAADKSALATTIQNEDGDDVRYYPFGNVLSHLVGYINNGGYGLENLSTYYLLTSNQNIIEQMANDLQGKKNLGDNLVTTIDMKLTMAAYKALGDNRGSVVITEPSTGKILTMISKPDFDPNTLADKWDEITAENADSVLVNRATQGLYPPGSTFKLVTLLEYYRENKNNFDKYIYDCSGGFLLESNMISCSHGQIHGTQDAIMSLANSCNSSFINMGLTLDIEKYQETTRKLLFNEKLPLDIEYKKSQFVLKTDASDWDIAQTAFGQGQTLITPMHLAMLGMTIANDGVLMNPYVMDYVESVNGLVVKRFKQEAYGRLMALDEVAMLQKGMEQVIPTSFGWLYDDSVPYTLAGKSGTAQYGTQGYEHSLFVSYSPIEKPEICVAVVLEGVNESGELRQVSAAEVTKEIYDYYWQK